MNYAIVSYRRIPHAAHYAHNHPANGHDLEQWDVTGEVRCQARTGHPLPPETVPANAVYHSGYLDRDRVQHHVFVRTAPLSATSCPHCAGAA